MKRTRRCAAPADGRLAAAALPWGVLLVLLAVPVRAETAGETGEPPLCFPERTVLWAATLVDADGTPFAGVRAGQVVRVLADRLGPARELADVETVGALRIRGRLRREQLLVFVREDVELEKGATWWLRGAPMQIVGPHGEQVRVTRAEPHGDAAPFPPSVVPCSLLSGRSVLKLHTDACHGATAWPVVERKHPVHRRDNKWFEFPLGAGEEATQIVADEIRRSGARSLVEVIDPWNYVRVRRWVPGADLAPGAPKWSGGRGHGCCEGELWHEYAEIGLRGGRLKKETPVRSQPGGPVLGAFPAGTAFRWKGRKDGFARILVRTPGLDDFTLAVAAWIPESLIDEPLPLSDKPSLRGRVRLPPDAPRSMRLRVVAGAARANSEGRSAETLEFPVGEDGTFLAEFDRQGDRWLEVWNEDRSYAAVIPRARVLPGGGDVVEVEVARPWTATLFARTSLGALVPGAEVEIGSSGPLSFKLLRLATTDALGRLSVALADAEYTARVTRPRFSNFALVAKTRPEVQLTVPRPPLLRGAVARDSDGRCGEGKVELRRYEEAPASLVATVSRDCLFAMEDVPADLVSARLSTSAGKSASVALPREDWSKPPADPSPVCIGERCEPGWQRSSVWVNVVDDRSALVADATVTAVDPSGREFGRCEAEKGICYLHHLPLRGRMVVRAQAKERRGQAEVDLTGGVAESLVSIR